MTTGKLLPVFIYFRSVSVALQSFQNLLIVHKLVQYPTCSFCDQFNDVPDGNKMCRGKISGY